MNQTFKDFFFSPNNFKNYQKARVFIQFQAKNTYSFKKFPINLLGCNKFTQW